MVVYKEKCLYYISNTLFRDDDNGHERMTEEGPPKVLNRCQRSIALMGKIAVSEEV